jgi:hypothetical protein
MKTNTQPGPVQLVLLRQTILGVTPALAVRQALATFACLMALAAHCDANPVQFIFTGTGSGSASAAAFTNAPFTIHLFADTSGVTLVPDPNNVVFSVNGSSSTIDIASIGFGSILAGTRVFVNQASNAVGFSLAGPSGLDLLDIQHPTFGTYDLMTSFGPVTVSDSHPGALEQFRDIASSLGPLSFTAARDITFTAVVVPEPSTIGLFAVGAVAFIIWRRHRHSCV